MASYCADSIRRSDPAELDSVPRSIQQERQNTQMTKIRSSMDKFKATLALEALRGDRTTQEVAAKTKFIHAGNNMEMADD